MEITRKIKAVSTKALEKGQIGFLIEKDDANNDTERWINIMGEEDELKILLNTIVKKGNIIKFEEDGQIVTELELIKEVKQETESDMIKISGKDYMTYKGLLSKAHEKGELFSMEILEKFVSEDMKRAWCIVRLTAAGQTFDGFGSSTPENTGLMTQSHPVEMAHTRAKGRALRDYLNIGEVMAEELAKN